MPKARGYLDDGHLELDNNTCERSIRPIALGRKNYLFMGSIGGGKAAAIAYTLMETCKLNNVDPEAWLTWVLNGHSPTQVRLADRFCHSRRWVQIKTLRGLAGSPSQKNETGMSPTSPVHQ